MAPGEYASVGPGKLRLKGVKDAKVDKKKKKKKAKPKDEAEGSNAESDSFHDKSVMLKNLQEEDAQFAKEERRKAGLENEKQVSRGAREEGDAGTVIVKTEAERRYEEQRRKRVRSSHQHISRPSVFVHDRTD